MFLLFDIVKVKLFIVKVINVVIVKLIYNFLWFFFGGCLVKMLFVIFFGILIGVVFFGLVMFLGIGVNIFVFFNKVVGFYVGLFKWLVDKDVYKFFVILFVVL